MPNIELPCGCITNFIYFDVLDGKYVTQLPEGITDPLTVDWENLPVREITEKEYNTLKNNFIDGRR